MSGVKSDGGKTDWFLLPMAPLAMAVQAMMYGAAKYGEDPYDPNWKRVSDPTRRYYSALCRHLFAWKDGEYLDTESHLPHLGHALFNLICLAWHDENPEE